MTQKLMPQVSSRLFVFLYDLLALAALCTTLGVVAGLIALALGL